MSGRPINRTLRAPLGTPLQRCSLGKPDHRLLRRGVDSAWHGDPDPRIGDLRLWSRS